MVPVIAIALWLMPSSDPLVETAQAESAALADVPSNASAEAPEVTTSPAPVAEESESASADASGAVGAVPAPAQSSTTVVAAPTTAAPTTSAPDTETTTSNEPLSMGDQALLAMEYPWRAEFPDWEVVFLGPRSGIRALTYPLDKRIEIFIRESDTVSSLHRVFAHELGHVIDVEFNTDADRQRWRDQRGIASSVPWWPNAEAPDFATGAGDFAEAFAVWHSGVTTRSTVGAQPSSSDIALLEELSRG